MVLKTAALAAFYWLPPVLYMALIFFLSSSSAAAGLPLFWKHQDKVLHFCEYLALALILARACTGPTSTPRSWRILAAGLAAAAFAVTDEIHQQFVPGREASLMDVAADSMGIVAGLLCWTVWLDRRATRERKIHDELDGAPDAGSA